MALSPEDVRRCTVLLETLKDDRSLLTALPENDRLAFLRTVGRVAIPEHDAEVRLAKAVRRRRAQEKREHDRRLRATTAIREARALAVFSAPQPSLPEFANAQPPAQAQGPDRLLQSPRHCYVCKVKYRRLHHFYDAMCWDCGEFNYAKRFQTAALQGKVALITGGRVKIGYQASLMLLRAGARVIATTRFPNDATDRYAREPDFEVWCHRLQIHGLDLRHAPSVELLAQHLARTIEKLDILINNAAQTVRRPPGFYRHLLEGEQRPRAALPAAAQPLLAAHAELIDALDVGDGPPSALAPSWRSHDPALGLRASAALSLIPYDLEQGAPSSVHFPAGRLDADLQQVDLRSVNSWRLSLSEVATAEMLEVHLVNAVAPFILCARLKPLLLRDRRASGHIVNVSAMEGSFSRGTKTDKHPHTNMAKAALNMLTLTSAPDYAKSGVFMNAVDTGWVTDEDPVVHAQRKTDELDFQPPLDIVDGAARVVDPVFEAFRTGRCVAGVFFKDYQPTAW
jgi:NAD(P)-dependent dehydrogenase (short-subunit alcohol dehydrogenase family)